MSGFTDSKHRLILSREKVHQIPEVQETQQRSSGDSGESKITAKFETSAYSSAKRSHKSSDTARESMLETPMSEGPIPFQIHKTQVSGFLQQSA